jgi:hypothetical protein
MNPAFLCRLVSFALYPYSFTLRNGMEEVIGSIPIRSTKQPILDSCTYGRSFKNLPMTVWRQLAPIPFVIV